MSYAAAIKIVEYGAAITRHDDVTCRDYAMAAIIGVTPLRRYATLMRHYCY